MKDHTLTKLTNKQLIESVFTQLESETKFHVVQEEFGNCYFLFEGEEDSICHFYIKEIPGFKFALWNTCRYDKIEDQIKDRGIGNTWADSLHINPKSELIFFTQYERDIDKFKPSRSGFVTGLQRWAYVEERDGKEVDVEEWILYDLIDILTFMHKHRTKAIVYSYRETKDIWDELSYIQCLKKRISSSYYYYKYKLKEWLELKKAIFITKHLAKKLKYYNSYIVDRGDCWHPRIDIFFRRKENATLEQLESDDIYADKIIDKYWDLFSFYDMDIDFSVDTTKEDLEKDKELKEGFWNSIKELKEDTYFDEEDKLDGAKLIYMKVVDDYEGSSN